MRKIILQHEMAVLVICFVLSRWLAAQSGITFQYGALFTYWQYLGVDSLRHNALNSVWYMHGQPPLFNLAVAAVLKISGGHDRAVFRTLGMLISFCNAALLLRILKSRVGAGWLPLAAALWYGLSPATILFENELFYTSFASLLLLLGFLFLNRFAHNGDSASLVAFFGLLVVLCLTRATFHLVWLLGTGTILAAVYYKKPRFKKVLAAGLVSVLLTSGWYIKNAVLFGSFSASSWTGINLSRIVFHEVAIPDSSSIAAIHPFLPISYYKKYISSGYQPQYAGKNDPVLLREMKNDSAINLNHAGYIQVSRRYMEACMQYIAQHPAGYMKNVATSFIIFFTPASSYFQVKENCNRLSLYDAIYSLNLSHFLSTKPGKKKALVASALPKLVVYALVFYLLARRRGTDKGQYAGTAFIVWTILYILLTTTLFEYGENMRFRYEVEPLFLVLVCNLFGKRKNPGEKKLAVKSLQG